MGGEIREAGAADCRSRNATLGAVPVHPARSPLHRSALAGDRSVGEDGGSRLCTPAMNLLNRSAGALVAALSTALASAAAPAPCNIGLYALADSGTVDIAASSDDLLRWRRRDGTGGSFAPAGAQAAKYGDVAPARP